MYSLWNYNYIYYIELLVFLHFIAKILVFIFYVVNEILYYTDEIFLKRYIGVGILVFYLILYTDSIFDI